MSFFVFEKKKKAHFMVCGRLDEALECSNNALKINANYPQAHYNHGNILRRLGRQTEVLRYTRFAYCIDREKRS